MVINGTIMHQKLVDRLTDQLRASGQKDARNMATSILRERGHMEQNSERLTAEGLAPRVARAGGPCD